MSEAAEAPRLLSGGNPQIPKGDGDEPVQAYVAAMPGWKQQVGRQVDAMVGELVPGVRKAVRWNSPFYGVDGKGWFLGIHCLTKAVRLTFFNGAALAPPPPLAGKDPNGRWFDVRENDPVATEQLRDWIRSASQLDGWHGF